MNCPHIEGCALYEQFQLNAALRFWKSLYCQSDYERCERFKTAQCGESIPADLLPNGARLSNPKKKV